MIRWPDLHRPFYFSAVSVTLWLFGDVSSPLCDSPTCSVTFYISAKLHLSIGNHSLEISLILCSLGAPLNHSATSSLPRWLRLMKIFCLINLHVYILKLCRYLLVFLIILAFFLFNFIRPFSNHIVENVQYFWGRVALVSEFLCVIGTFWVYLNLIVRSLTNLSFDFNQCWWHK